MPDTALIEYQKYIKNNNFATIDVGGRKGDGGTALAYFTDYKNYPIFTKIFSSSINDFELRINALSLALKAELKPCSRDFSIFIEQPQFFQTNKGQVAAESGSLVKLVYFYGRIFQLCFDLGFNHVIPLRIVDWKGQLTKKHIETRIERLIGKEYVYHNDCDDAIGMGLYLKGLL